MVKHIVMFKPKEKNAENVESAVSILRALDGKIESLRLARLELILRKQSDPMIWFS